MKRIFIVVGLALTLLSPNLQAQDTASWIRQPVFSLETRGANCVDVMIHIVTESKKYDPDGKGLELFYQDTGDGIRIKVNDNNRLLLIDRIDHNYRQIADRETPQLTIYFDKYSLLSATETIAHMLHFRLEEEPPATLVIESGIQQRVQPPGERTAHP